MSAKEGAKNGFRHIILAMRNILISVSVAFICIAASAASKETVKRAYIDSEGRVHIVTAAGGDKSILPKKWQAGGGFEAVEIAPDGETVGRLADQMLTPLEGGTNHSYAVPLEIDIWRAGHLIRRFMPSASVIRDWIFLRGGKQVAYRVAPPHGQQFYDCTLMDVATGKQLAHWSLDRSDYAVPDGAKQVLKGDPLSGPDEISNWNFGRSTPGNATPVKETPRPKP